MSVKRQHGYLAVLICMLGMVFLAGCEKKQSSAETGEAKGPPKLAFHKPRNFGLAVERIREIHKSLVGEEEMAAPISYTVVEVNHAHPGGSPHVHYELIDLETETPADGAVTHSISIDAFTELNDVVKWLPNIASDSDMGPKEWKQVKEAADQLTAQLEKLTGENSAAKRKNYQTEAESFDKAIGKLEALAKPNAAAIL